MRRLSKSLVVAAVVLSLAVPAFAKPSEDPSADRGRLRIVKIVKQWVKSVLDELSVPHP